MTEATRNECRAGQAKRGLPQLHSKATATHKRAITIAELIIALSATTILMGALTQSLQAARQRSRDEVCLNNLQHLGIAIRTYASDYNDRLPGSLYPAVFRHQSIEAYHYPGQGDSAARFSLSRQLGWLLRDIAESNRLTACPTMAGVVPDRHFDEFETTNGYYVFPTHYCVNNYGPTGSSSGGLSGNARETNPGEYFGFPSYLGAPPSLQRTPPRLIGEIPNPAREWMIADAWYRGRSSSFTFLQQDGPYQSGWSGAALPYFAPHRQPTRHTARVSSFDRSQSAADVVAGKTDGVTNTLFFDGHAASVPSRTASIRTSTGTEFSNLLYGFPGTVNGTPLSSGLELIWR